MLVPLTHFNWQVLRTALRAELAGTPALGRELRVSPTRKTQDGTFLDDLVAIGLLVVAKKAASPGEKNEPAQFRTRYKLTKLGRHAAEYGEFERTHTPEDRPLEGVAAELAKAREAAKKRR